VKGDEGEDLPEDQEGGLRGLYTGQIVFSLTRTGRKPRRVAKGCARSETGPPRTEVFCEPDCEVVPVEAADVRNLKWAAPRKSALNFRGDPGGGQTTEIRFIGTCDGVGFSAS
jgi:hypothetical protein